MKHRYYPVLLAACAALLPGLLHSQSAPANSAPVSPADEAVLLDPFNVTSGKTERYMASNSISGTALNMPLKDIPMTINVITSEFLDDAALGDMQRSLDFNSSITQTLRGEARNSEPHLLAIRGFTNRNVLLDGLRAGDYLPIYLIDRIEVVKGPNTLYGQSDPGGLVNMISKRPGSANGATVTARWDSWGGYKADVDANVVGAGQRLKVRVLGSYEETDGWRWVDGNRAGVAALIADAKLSSRTDLGVSVGQNTKRGVPTIRATYPFMVRPTDLNGDGDLADIVGGVPEASTRYNNDFVPREWNSSTAAHRVEQTGNFLQGKLTHRVSSSADLQYVFAFSDQNTVVNFREFNTFNAAGNVTAEYQASNNDTIAFAHSLNGSIRLETGALRHSILVGGRYNRSKNNWDIYRLRPGTPAERAVLDAMRAGGRNIRYDLSRADILNNVPIWLDPVPTEREIFNAGFRANNIGDIHQEVSSLYLTDSVTMMENRLRLLAGLRWIEIVDYQYTVAGAGGAKNKARDTSYQLGANYAVSEHLVPYANVATSFNPNGIDSSTGRYFPPEESFAWEVGFKLDRLMDGLVSGSVAYFHIEKNNVVRTDFNPITFSNSDVGISDDLSEGLDLELFINPTPNWQTTFGYSYTDARTVKSVTTAQGLALEGAIPHKYSFFTSYSFTEGALKGLRFGGGGFIVRGPVQQFGTSSNRLIREDGYSEFSLFARYELELFGKPVTLGANVANLTDETYFRGRAMLNDPRRFFLSARVQY